MEGKTLYRRIRHSGLYTILTGEEELDVDVAETKSLLEGNASGIQVTAPINACCSANNSVFLSTPHSLHLCERNDKLAIADGSPGGDDSDYYTPEDPNTTILVDQGTDTSLDISQDLEVQHVSDEKRNESTGIKWRSNGRDWQQDAVKAETIVICENDGNEGEKTSDGVDGINEHSQSIQSQLSPSRFVLMSHLEGSLPGTPASNASNRSSGDSFSSTSSTRFLLPHQSHETLPE